MCHDLRGRVARAIVHNDDLMLAKILKAIDCGKRASDVSCFIVRDDNETDKVVLRHCPSLPI
jgi:hypothetical protein